MSTEHATPIPWRVDGQWIVGTDPECRTMGFPVIPEENAKDRALIVRAVNAHNDLIEALEDMIDYIERYAAQFGDKSLGMAYAQKAREALQKARGE